LTLDYSHFVYHGCPQAEVEPLLERSRHVHVRSARLGRLHTTLERNEIDFGRILAKLEQINYTGHIALEYEAVSPDRDDADAVDVLSETLRLREHLGALGSSA
jgi:sugar phosphate isomerase/epimerase